MANYYADKFISTLSEDELEKVIACNTLEDFICFIAEYGIDINEYLDCDE